MVLHEKEGGRESPAEEERVRKENSNKAVVAGTDSGASPLFSPRHTTEEAACAELAEGVHRSPRR